MRLVVAGLLIRTWAAGTLRKKKQLATTGPYAIVRHPIYSGLSLAILATVLLRPGWLGLLGAAMIIASFVIKYRLEERLLMEELGPEYKTYRKNVAALVPFFTGRG